MANQEQLNLLKQGVKVWNRWRVEHVDIFPDLSEAYLQEASLRGADLSHTNLQRADLDRATLKGANLSFADLNHSVITSANLVDAILTETNLSYSNLSYSNLINANMSHANFSHTDLSHAQLTFVNLSGANLNEALLSGVSLGFANLSGAYLENANLVTADFRGANLSRSHFKSARLGLTNLTETDLSEADLSGADLSHAILIKTNLSEANLTNCSIYGVSIWDVDLQGATQIDLVITPPNQPMITVDNLEVAQFIYLLLNNNKIREIIDTITSKAVLILGRFTPNRKVVLDSLRDELRKHNYLPVLFDFEKPASRDLTETVSTLAHLARFIIVDLTDPSSVPHEVATVIPHTVVPVQPLLSQEPLMIDGKVVERREYAMFEDLRRRYHWVLPTFRYQDTAELLVSIKGRVIEPAEQKVKELTGSEKRTVSSDTHTMGW